MDTQDSNKGTSNTDTQKSKKSSLTLSVMKEKLGVCRLECGREIPGWAVQGGFYSITRTSEELSVVCPEKNVPAGVTCERTWRVLKVEGPLDFGLVGILASLSTLLSEEGISLFAISTYDTDYILLKAENLEKAIDALTSGGYEILI